VESLLILFNYYDRTYWLALLPVMALYNSGPMSNAWFYQGRAGVKPTADLDIKASLSYANADKKPLNYVGGTMVRKLILPAPTKSPIICHTCWA